MGGCRVDCEKNLVFSIFNDFEAFFDFEAELLIIVQYKNLLVNLSFPISVCIHQDAFLRPNKGYTAASSAAAAAAAAAELLFLEDELSLTYQVFFGFTRFDLVTFQSFSTFLHLKRS